MNDLIELIAMGPFGSDIKVDNFVNEGVPVLNGSNVSSIKLIETSFKYVTPEKSEALKKANAKRGDIVITHRGTVGQISYIPEDSKYDNYVISQSQFRVSLKRDLVDPIYFTYYFHTDEGQRRLLSFKSHVGVPALAQATTNFRLLEFPLISLPTQQKIAKVLSDLDSKIELNNKINAELEAMAKTLYDYWFVQFDFPDVYGKPYKTSGGKMVWKEELKREIPEGWEVGTLLDISTFTNGLACQKFRPNDNEDSYRVIKIREMGSGFTENSEFVSTNIPEKVIVYNGDILFSWSATLDVKIWTGGTGGLNQHIFKVTSKKYPKSYYYFELLNYLQHFKMMAELRKTTMGHITKDHLKESRITIPPMDLINKLDGIIKPILEKKVKLEKENQELASLRDWLLPMLMNGQVKVGGYEVEDKELEMVAEPTLFKEDSIKNDLDAAIAAIYYIEKQKIGYAHAKTGIHKTLFFAKTAMNQDILKGIQFQRYLHGTFSKQVANAIENNQFLETEKLLKKGKIFKLRKDKTKLLQLWMNEEKNKSFVTAIEELVYLYQDPIISNNIDKMELMNTVYKIMLDIKTSSFNIIWQEMQNWPINRECTEFKSDKFSRLETKEMIQFITKTGWFK